MAISADSPTFKLQFTDGSFLTMLNTHYVRAAGFGELTLIYPNIIWCNFESWTGPITKYDRKGNQYDFYPDGLVVNGRNYRVAQYLGRMIHLNFDPSDSSLHIWFSAPLSSEFPTITDDSSRNCVLGWAYNGNCGSVFSSIGAAIAKGQQYTDRMSWGYYGYYDIQNVLPRGNNSPFNSVNRFAGNRATESSTESSKFVLSILNFTSGTGWSGPVIVNNIEEVVENFDPVSPLPPTPSSNDPFTPGGIAVGGGGGGTFDLTSDSIDIPQVPAISASDAGFITLFNPTLAELRNLASYMWTGLFDVNNFRKIFADPMDCILGLSIVPVQVPSGSSQVVKVGNISTGVQMTTAAQQYVEVDCGSITISEYWGAYLDYEPFTKIEIYLPYIGTHAICTDDVMGKSITIKYHVDILSGSCTAYIKAGNSVLYEFIGQCSSSIPITGNDWTNVINGAIQIAASIGSMVATGGAAAPSTEGAAARAVTHKQLNAIHETSSIASTAVNSLKPTVEKSGAMGGTGGMLAIQKPYVIITRPRQALPQNQNYYTGYPSFTTEMLGNLSGFTIVDSIHLAGIPGTNEELVEIENILSLGVIL